VTGPEEEEEEEESLFVQTPFSSHECSGIELNQ
jgi:hypothetical protein